MTKRPVEAGRLVLWHVDYHRGLYMDISRPTRRTDEQPLALYIARNSRSPLRQVLVIVSAGTW